MGEPIDITAENVALRVAYGGMTGPVLVVEVGGRDLITIRGSWRDLQGLAGGVADRLSQLVQDYPELRSPGESGPGPAGPLATDHGRGQTPSAAQSGAATDPVGYRRPGE